MTKQELIKKTQWKHDRMYRFKKAAELQKGGESVVNPPTMLTINQTAERSGLAKHYVRHLCLENKIRHIKAGNKYLINFERFVDYLNTGESLSPKNEVASIRAL